MNDKDVIPTFFLRRKKTSQDYFTFCTHEAVNAINELIDIAEKEENQNIRWKNTKTREYLINYREYVYSNFSLGSAQSYFGRILTVYRHFEIEIPKLPYYSTKNSHHYAPILYDDLPDRLSKCNKRLSSL